MITLRSGDVFDTEKTAFCGQTFRAKRTDDGAIRFITGYSSVDIKSTCLPDLSTLWQEYFDLSSDYRELISKIDPKDVFMKEAKEAGLGIRILRQEPWETLVSFIISQRKSIPAISKCIEQLCDRFGEPFKGPEGEVLRAFPEPEAIMDAGFDELKACGLGYRIDYVKDAAAKVVSGEIDIRTLEEMPDDELFETLQLVKGVGKKVADCVCLYGFHRMSRSPVDVWIKRVIDEHYEGRNPFLAYGDAAGLMQQYVFYLSRSYNL